MFVKDPENIILKIQMVSKLFGGDNLGMRARASL